ncbi:uncharacterized protein LOC107272915 isoform X2 [Cephus cinctus]|uniref:Uncharacterized protein LOC107272915 isoform X2 n=1 Tax=Cephus cinctus TaxID=211228 RepID=A0AAJ7CAQ5_CEPCN|nr:uncharacterized protein LOC107272915 isoform X2 [Cephus cinctus]
MNIDSYCKEGKNGNFCILFRNTSALSVDQIHKIFSEFGNVLSVNCAGNERGMRFVSYKSKIEAINSIMSLKGHESINLTPWMNKEEKDLKSQNKYKGTTDKEQLIKESGATKDNLHGSAGNRNSMMESEKLNDDIPDLITSKEVMQNVNDYNAYSNNYASTLKKIKIVQAGEVIVANISKPFGAAYILHLFESYQPICISSIMTTTQSIRYCHVYFQTPLEAHKVEKKFDKFPLHDNNLIVLRPEKLASEIQLL